jgi:hypothetical protein
MQPRLTALLLASACGFPVATTAFDGTGPPPVRNRVWIAGIAGNGHLAATVTAGNHVLHCNDRARWPAGVAGQPVVVVGILGRSIRVSTPAGARAFRDAAREGEAYVISSCALPPAETSGELLDAARAVLGTEAEEMVAYRAGDTAMVRGVKAARVGGDDAVVEDRQASSWVFVRRDGAWRLASAPNRPLRP